MTRSKAVGVFDSGFGGLAILKEIQKKLPQYNYVYLGDTARTPYGTRSRETVYEFTKQAVDFLFAHNCGLIIFACNTASAEALRKIQKEYLPKHYPGKRVLGVIVPALEEAERHTKNHRIGVIATEGTVASNAFVSEFKKRDPQARIFQQACPLLVPLVEAGEHKTPVAKLIHRKYLDAFHNKNIDTLILGCTHYGHLEKEISTMMGKRVKVISEGPVVAEKLKEYLVQHQEIESTLARNKKTIFYSTDLGDRFKKLGKLFFGRSVDPLLAQLETSK